MIKRVLVLLIPIMLVICSVVSASTPIPFGQVTSEDNFQIVGQGSCPSGHQILVIQGTKDGKDYTIYVSDENKFIMVDESPGEDTPVWVGTIKDGKFTVKESLTYAELKTRTKGACEFLSPEKA